VAAGVQRDGRDQLDPNRWGGKDEAAKSQFCSYEISYPGMGGSSRSVTPEWIKEESQYPEVTVGTNRKKKRFTQVNRAGTVIGLTNKDEAGNKKRKYSNRVVHQSSQGLVDCPFSLWGGGGEL